MLCDKYKEALIEATANAAPLPGSLREHVDGCACCTETLAAQRRLFAMMEERLQCRANARVPPNFDHRVRAALHAEVSSERKGYSIAFTFAAMAVAAAVLMAILFTHTLRRSSKETARNSAVEPKHLAAMLPKTPNSPEPRSAPRAQSRSVGALKAPRALEAFAGRNTEPEVLVPKGQEELLTKYMEGLAARSTRIVLSASLQHQPEMRPIEVPSVQISQMAVKPLPDLGAD
jgi:hypothetical protein